MYRFGVVSLFPQLVAPVMDFGVVGRAAERGLVALEQVSPRAILRPTAIVRSTTGPTAADREWC